MNLIEFTLFIIATKFPKKVTHEKASWAIVTASNDGLGLGFAEVLAKQGYNIVQISRNLSKMRSVSAELKSKYSIQTKEIVFEFDKISSNFINSYKALHDSLKDGQDNLNIKFVVNNVGTATMGFEKNLDQIIQVLSINIWSNVMISKLIIDNEPFKGNKVKFINVSSITAIPGLGILNFYVYAATKSFIMVFTEVLISEGVQALAFIPGWVDTPASRLAMDLRRFVITPEQCAEAAVKQIGTVSTSYGHAYHWIGNWHYRLVNFRKAWLRLI